MRPTLPRHRPLSTSELAHLVGCSAKFIRDEIAGGHLKAVRIGRGHVIGSRLLIAPDEADRYLRSLGVNPPLMLAVPMEFVWSSFKVLFDGFPYPAMLTAGTVVDVTSALCAFYGWDRKQLIGQPILTNVIKPTREELERLPANAGIPHAVGRCGDGRPPRHVYMQRIPVLIAGQVHSLTIHAPYRTQRT